MLQGKAFKKKRMFRLFLACMFAELGIWWRYLGIEDIKFYTMVV